MPDMSQRHSGSPTGLAQVMPCQTDTSSTEAVRAGLDSVTGLGVLGDVAEQRRIVPLP